MENKVGQQIKALRVKAGLNQQELTDRVNVILKTTIKRNTISNYENGVSEPSIDVIKAIANALGVAPETIINAPSIDGGTDLISKGIQKFRQFFLIMHEPYDLILDPIYKQLRGKNSEGKRDGLIKQFADHPFVKKQRLQHEYPDDEMIEFLVDEFLKRKTQKKSS